MNRISGGNVTPLTVSSKKDVARDHLERAWGRFDTARVLFEKGDFASAVQEARKMVELATLAAMIADGSKVLKGADILNERPGQHFDAMKEILKRTGRLDVALDRFIPGTINPSEYWNVQDAQVALDYASETVQTMLRIYAPEVLASHEAEQKRQNDTNELARQRAEESSYEYEDQELTPFAANG